MLRPQPLGIFPLPANFLLLPESAKDTNYLDDLMIGISDGECPDEIAFYKFAIDGDIAQSISHLPPDKTPENKFNDFILDSSPDKYSRLKEELTGIYEKLLDVSAYALNYISEPPNYDDLDGEIRGIVLLTNASYNIEQRKIETAIKQLEEAVEVVRNISPMFYGQLLISLAETQHQFQGADANVIQTYNNALAVLKDSKLESVKASVYMNLGTCYQEISAGRRGALLEAVRCYQEALKFYTKEESPEEFAFAQNNLALAYLSMPLVEAGDQLRVAIAIQALRESLKIYKKETHGELWASTQLNLANALQYAPSSHIEENLQEAVNLYEEILSVRQPTQNPVGYARLLANQGNALAHLGIFDHAVPKLTEARTIFSQINDAESADSIGEILAEIEQQLSQGEKQTSAAQT